MGLITVSVMATGLTIGPIAMDTRLTIGLMAIMVANFTEISVGVAVMIGEVVGMIGAEVLIRVEAGFTAAAIAAAGGGKAGANDCFGLKWNRYGRLLTVVNIRHASRFADLCSP